MTGRDGNGDRPGGRVATRRPLTRTSSGDRRPPHEAIDREALGLFKAIVEQELPRFVAGTRSKSGGMGQLREVHDRLLDRVLARKRPIEALREKGWKAFLHEAQVTASLNHPAIVPVFDLGKDKEGLYYLMPWIEGDTLHDVLAALRDGEPAARRRWNKSHLLYVFRTVCGAVAHAHGQGLVHRDLKPDQVVLGRHGEVMVLDWGLAARLGGVPERPSCRSSEVHSPVSVRSGQTILDGVHGAPEFLAPERLALDPVPADPAQDVFSLGAVLYCILTLAPPIAVDIETTLSDEERLKELRTRVATVQPPSGRAWLGPIDLVWDTICARCLAVEPADRYADADELYRAVEDALSEIEESMRSRERAAREVRRGDEQAGQLAAVQEEMEAVSDRVRRLRESIPANRPVDDKRVLWDAEDRQARLARERARRFADVEQRFGAALSLDPGNPEARQRLADLYLARLHEATAAGQTAEREYFLARLAQYDDGSRMAALTRPARVRVHVAGVQGEVCIADLVEHRRRLVPGEWRVAGRTPEVAVEVPPGRFLLHVRAEGRATARYALRVGGGEEVTLSPALPPAPQIPDGFAYIPAGPAWLGGDAGARGAEPLRRRAMGDYAISVFPTTMGEYREFVDTLPIEEARRRVPQDNVDGTLLWRPTDHGWSIPEKDPHGEPLIPTFPVMLVLPGDAEAYAAWWGERWGCKARLPTRDEWEYAARSCDGRLFPWGDVFEANYCWSREIQGRRQLPAAVGRCPQDASPCGIRDLAGSVGDWVSDAFEGGEGLRQVAGGSWFASSLFCRLAARVGFHGSRRSPGIGFRLMIEL